MCCLYNVLFAIYLNHFKHFFTHTKTIDWYVLWRRGSITKGSSYLGVLGIIKFENPVLEDLISESHESMLIQIELTSKTHGRNCQRRLNSLWLLKKIRTWQKKWWGNNAALTTEHLLLCLRNTELKTVTVKIQHREWQIEHNSAIHHITLKNTLIMTLTSSF